eukprot:5450351-Prymnesium_polylepis.1
MGDATCATASMRTTSSIWRLGCMTTHIWTSPPCIQPGQLSSSTCPKIAATCPGTSMRTSISRTLYVCASKDANQGGHSRRCCTSAPFFPIEGISVRTPSNVRGCLSKEGSLSRSPPSKSTGWE